MFIPELTKAVISGQKTQTRRMIKGCEVDAREFEKPEVIQYLIDTQADYKVGEVAYIREGFRFPKDFDSKKPSEVEASPVEYRVGGAINCIGDHIKDPGKWRSPHHLPSKFARHFVTVTDVRVERIKNISNKDSLSEGVKVLSQGGMEVYKNYFNESNQPFMFPHNSFKSLWISIYGRESFHGNPWVFVYTFKQCDKTGIEL
ncbi:hypothetical protein E9993_14775 [Labilibacter sediminis]|nr:hypothetical protein E9993_14775 [Labilibacter sediminis]